MVHYNNFELIDFINNLNLIIFVPITFFYIHSVHLLRTRKSSKFTWNILLDSYLIIDFLSFFVFKIFFPNFFFWCWLLPKQNLFIFEISGPWNIKGRKFFNHFINFSVHFLLIKNFLAMIFSKHDTTTITLQKALFSFYFWLLNIKPKTLNLKMIILHSLSVFCL